MTQRPVLKCVQCNRWAKNVRQHQEFHVNVCNKCFQQRIDESRAMHLYVKKGESYLVVGTVAGEKVTLAKCDNCSLRAIPILQGKAHNKRQT